MPGSNGAGGLAAAVLSPGVTGSTGASGSTAIVAAGGSGLSSGAAAAGDASSIAGHRLDRFDPRVSSKEARRRA